MRKADTGDSGKPVEHKNHMQLPGRRVSESCEDSNVEFCATFEKELIPNTEVNSKELAGLGK